MPGEQTFLVVISCQCRTTVWIGNPEIRGGSSVCEYSGDWIMQSVNPLSATHVCVYVNE
jgi:hypothetical protein